MISFALGFALTVQTVSGESVRQIIRSAELAVVGDSTERVERRWSAELDSDSTAAQALLGLGWSAFYTYRYDVATRLLSLAVERADGREHLRRWAYIGLADVALWQGDLANAGRLYENVLVDGEAAMDSVAVVRALTLLAGIAARTTGPQAAAQYFERARPWLNPADSAGYAIHMCQRAAVDPATTVGDMWDAANRARAAGAYRAQSSCLVAVVQGLMNRGQTDSAATFSRAAIQRLEEARDDHTLATVLQWTGYYYRLLGGFDTALNSLQRAVVLGDRSGNRLATAWALINLSALAINLGDVSTGTGRAQRATTMLEEMGDQ